MSATLRSLLALGLLVAACEPAPVDTPPDKVPDVVPGEPCDPGNVPPTAMHRLTRTEIARVVGELLQVDAVPIELLPVEERLNGFTNQTSSVSVSDTWTAQIRSLVAEVGEAATGSALQEVRFEVEGRAVPPPRVVDLTGNGDGRWAFLTYNDRPFNLPVTVPETGRWRVFVRARWWGGYEFPDVAEPSDLTVSLDGVALGTLPITGTLFAPYDLPFELETTAGDHVLGLRITWKGPVQTNAATTSVGLDFVELQGPLEGQGTPLADALRACMAAGTPAGECAATLVGGIARRAWRRDPTSEEQAALAALIADALGADDTPQRALGMGLEAVLLSPSFLFRIEAPPAGAPRSYALDAPSLAARLADLVWGSVPDDALLDCAASGALLDVDGPCSLSAQAERLLADPRASALVEDFGFEWLELDTLPGTFRSPERFPRFDDDLAASMLEETHRMLLGVVGGDAPVESLLDAGRTWVDGALADHYGLPAPAEPGWVETSADRGGLLQQASVLTVTSTSTRTSPTRRGAYVLARLLCDPPRPPPPGVPTLDEDGSEGAVRDAFDAHTSVQPCQGCHSGMDPYGYALDHYDPVGQWRDTLDDGSAIRASVTLPDGSPIDGAADLQGAIREDARFTACVAEKLFTWGLHRKPEAADQATLDAMLGPAHAPTFGSMLQALVASPSLQCRHVPPSGDPE